MKYVIAALIILSAQIAQGQDSKNAFSEAFEDMFQFEDPVYITQNTPPPPVPLDGGLMALFAAGGAVAYKKYRSNKA